MYRFTRTLVKSHLPRMQGVMHDILEHYYSYAKDKTFIMHTLIAYTFFQISLLVSSYAGLHATLNAGASLHDVILDAIPRINSAMIHGMITSYMANIRVMLIFLLFPFIPFALYSLSILILVRAFFISLTYLGPPFMQAAPYSTDTFGGDLFFSGHTAYPFLLALIFWELRYVRYYFLISMALLATSALIGHYHYSIDIFAAPFIAYGVFMFCRTHMTWATVYSDRFTDWLTRYTWRKDAAHDAGSH